MTRCYPEQRSPSRREPMTAGLRTLLYVCGGITVCAAGRFSSAISSTGA